MPTPFSREPNQVSVGRHSLLDHSIRPLPLPMRRVDDDLTDVAALPPSRRQRVAAIFRFRRCRTAFPCRRLVFLPFHCRTDSTDFGQGIDVRPCFSVIKEEFYWHNNCKFEIAKSSSRTSVQVILNVGISSFVSKGFALKVRTR